MTTKLIKNIFYSVLFTTLLVSCANDDNYDAIESVCEDQTNGSVANITGDEVYAMTNSTLNQFPVDGPELYLEAYITSSDRGGNFFKVVSMETADGRGLSISLDMYNVYTKGYVTGRKVLIKLNGLYRIMSHSSLSLGALYVHPTTGALNTGRIPERDIAKHILFTCDYKAEEDLVHYVSVSQARNNSYVNKLIEIEGVEFTQKNVPYYDPANVIGGSTNRFLKDETGNNTVIFRTGSFASYAGDLIPNNSGSIRGVMTKFNSDFQFVARDRNDIKLTEAAAPTHLGGTDIQFLSNFTENFESYPETGSLYAPGIRSTFPKYINDILAGPRYWSVTSFSGNKYLQMSAHNTNSECKSYFMVPANLTNATLSFKTKNGFYNGDVLKVYYTTSYTAGGLIDPTTFVDITSNFEISTGNTTGYAVNFTNSGTHTITAGGNGFIVFEYSGTHPTGATTTMQIDDITIE